MRVPREKGLLEVTGPPQVQVCTGVFTGVFGVCGRVRVSVCPERPRVSAGTTGPPRVSLCHVEVGGCELGLGGGTVAGAFVTAGARNPVQARILDKTPACGHGQATAAAAGGPLAGSRVRERWSHRPW